MKTLYFLVEGDTEEEFIKNLVAGHFINKCFVQPIKITTNPKFGKRGGFTTYEHLKTDAENLLRQKREIIVTSFVDYFRLPTDVPNFDGCRKINDIDNRLECLEKAIKTDIGYDNFFPYIQKHEFEALLFSSNRGFENYYDTKTARKTAKVIKSFSNPEEINDNPATSPSNRLKNIVPTYSKVLEGNIIALDVGLETILAKCPRFNNWIENLINLV